MTFLMLARAEPDARALLQRALRARYGVRPVPVESVRMYLLTGARGPLGLPVRVEMVVSCVGTTHWRCDTKHRLFGLTIRRSVESFDGGAFFAGQNGRITAHTDPRILASYRRHLWSGHALFLTPITEEHVILKMAGERCIQAIPDSYPDDIATLTFNPDDTLAKVEIERFRLEDERLLTSTLYPEAGLQTFNDFVVPVRLVHEWQDGRRTVFGVTGAELNPRIPLTEFSLQPTA